MAKREPPSRPGRRQRLLTLVVAIALQRRLTQVSADGGRAATLGPALLSLAALPRRAVGPDAEGAAQIAPLVLASLLLLRLPAWLAARRGVVGLALRTALLALTFDAWSSARSADAIAGALDRDDLEDARGRLQDLGHDSVPQQMTAREIADRATDTLAAGSADSAIGPWLAYALFDLPGAVAYHLPILLTTLWGQIPGAVLRGPFLSRAAGAGPRLALLRGVSGRAAGLAYGAAAPAVGADPVAAVRASLSADEPPVAALCASLEQDVSSPADDVRRAARLHRVALALAAAAAAVLIVFGRRPLSRRSA